MKSASQELLHDAALGALDEFDQFLHVGEIAEVFRISATACEVFNFARSSNRKARFNACNRSDEKPLRSRPIVLMPKLFVSRSVTIFENGGTSCVITVEAPM